MSEISRQDEFFVGYLATPSNLRRFLAAFVVALFATLALVAWELASGQRNPGNGSWNLSDTTELVGTIHLAPAPLVRIAERDGTATSVLLVDQGKIGAARRIEFLDGKTAKLRGHLLVRGPLKILELNDDIASIQPLEASALLPPLSRPDLRFEDALLTGQIIDPKCFAGAMKPGDGKTHKSCAALCLRGGIPPVFVTNESAQSGHYLVIDETGKSPTGAVLDELIGFAGDPIQIRGRVAQWHDLRILKIDPGAVQRR